MKIILSRKGYDNSYGGGASPIMPNGDLISIPIPSANNEIGTAYSDINYGKKSYLELMKELGLKIPKDEDCHFDPDLIPHATKREPNWTGIFGQNGYALSHLEKTNLEKGDLFLFFGSFKRTFLKKTLKFEKDYERHIIFGYLIIDKIINPQDDPENAIFNSHPHFKNSELYKDSNTVYIAKDENDYGTFKYREELVLTRKGFSKSQWELPMIFHPKNGTQISRHTDKNIEIRGDKMLLNSVGIGHDFVIDGNPEIEKWAKEIIAHSEKI